MSTLSQQPDEAGRSEVSRSGLWFGLLGGAFAWLAHLMLAYVIAEFGCVSRLEKYTYLGITGVAWMLLAVTAVTLLAAAAATLVAYRSGRRLRAGAGDLTEAGRPRASVATTGLITSGLFTLIIVVESIPIFYYLQSC